MQQYKKYQTEWIKRKDTCVGKRFDKKIFCRKIPFTWRVVFDIWTNIALKRHNLKSKKYINVIIMKCWRCLSKKIVSGYLQNFSEIDRCLGFTSKKIFIWYLILKAMV